MKPQGWKVIRYDWFASSKSSGEPEQYSCRDLDYRCHSLISIDRIPARCYRGLSNRKLGQAHKEDVAEGRGHANNRLGMEGQERASTEGNYLQNPNRNGRARG